MADLRVSIQQAGANALATFLTTKLSSDIVIESRWPSPDRVKPSKIITIYPAGRRVDTPIDLRIISKENVGDHDVSAVWQLAACKQPFQMDVWATADVLRDDMMAQLDDALHSGESSLGGLFAPTPVGIGSLLRLGDGWENAGTIADFVFEEPDYIIESDAVGRSVYRALFKGNAYFMLTVTTQTARQKVINFNLRLSETDEMSDFGTYSTPEA